MKRKFVFQRLQRLINKPTGEYEQEIDPDRTSRNPKAKVISSDEDAAPEAWSATAYLRGDVKSGKPVDD